MKILKSQQSKGFEVNGLRMYQTANRFLNRVDFALTDSVVICLDVQNRPLDLGLIPALVEDGKETLKAMVGYSLLSLSREIIRLKWILG